MIGIYDKDGIVRYFLDENDFSGTIQIDEIPEGKYLVKVDTSGDVPKPLFEDIPKSEIEQRLEALELGMAEYLGG